MRRCTDTARRFRAPASSSSGGGGMLGAAAAGAAMPRGWGAGWDLGQWMEAQCYARSSKQVFAACPAFLAVRPSVTSY